MVKLEVIEGSCKDRKIEFAEQDTFTIGRASDCNCVVQGDNTFSRHHLLLEINQNNVNLKDLGSLNGTRINGKKIGGRDKSVKPEDAECSAPVALRDGDRIEAGNNVMILKIDAPALCVDCGEEIPAAKKKAMEFINGTYMCQKCRDREAEKNKPKAKAEVKKPEEVRLDVKQREKAEENPGAVIEELLREFLDLQGKAGSATPQIEGYTDLTKIGEGGFGAVFKAKRVADGRIVALKTMLQTRKPPRKMVLLFEREKEIALQLRHPNVVRCERTGVWKDIHYIEMEFVEGGDVFNLMQKGQRAIPLKEAAPILLQALEGLAYAHEAEVTVTTEKGKKKVKGVIHRDLKPPNILLARENGRMVAKVSDFGLAKGFAAAGCTQGSISKSTTGAFCGSPPYMAPEHILNYKYVKPATDVFEMAATVFHILTGEIVWPLRRGVDECKVILEERPRRLKDHLRDCPKRLAEVMDRALTLKASERYQDGREFLNAMKNAL